jgi:cell shape-determining protein MreD
MNKFQTIMLFGVSFLAVFGEATLSAPREWLGAQVDLLPALMIYAGLYAGLPAIALLAISSGVWLDSLSANPLGVSILPLFLVGWLASLRRDLILRDSPFAQFVLGTTASLLVPVLTLLMLLSGGQVLLLGWGTLWQLIVMTGVGGIATPFIFSLMAWSNRMFGYQPHQETSFRSDREIRHGKVLKPL